jgi:hypothetical protein
MKSKFWPETIGEALALTYFIKSKFNLIFIILFEIGWIRCLTGMQRYYYPYIITDMHDSPYENCTLVIIKCIMWHSVLFYLKIPF